MMAPRRVIFLWKLLLIAAAPQMVWSDERREFDTLTRWTDFGPTAAEVYRGDRELWFRVAARPDSGRLEFPRLNNVVLSVDLLGPDSITPLVLVQTPERWQVDLPTDVSYPAQVKLTTAQPVELAEQPHLIRPAADQAIVLEARHAVPHGEKLQFEPQIFKNTVGYWVNPQDWVEWHLEVVRPGAYQVRILQGCGEGQGGSRVRLEIDGGNLEFDVLATGHFQNFVWRDLGRIHLPQVGRQQLRLRVVRLAQQAVMDVRQIRLEPVVAHQLTADRDLRDVVPDLIVPPITNGSPKPGHRVRQSVDADHAESAYHVLYLPTDWRPDRQYPVIVELTGNGPYENSRGDRCSGRIEDASLGFGISGGFGCLWLTLPFLNGSGDQNVLQWWGDPSSYQVQPTLDYWQRAIDETCRRYGGDPERIVLAGFSRGSIACNYLGLYDDRTARRWRAFVCNSHYDGVVEQWPYPGADRASARVRLARLAGRQQFICSEPSATAGSSMSDIQAFLARAVPKGGFTFRSTGFVNHDDRWILRPSPCRAELRRWLHTVCQQPSG